MQLKNYKNAHTKFKPIELKNTIIALEFITHCFVKHSLLCTAVSKLRTVLSYPFKVSKIKHLSYAETLQHIIIYIVM